MYYNPDEVAYEQLLDVFFQRVDPTTLNRQVQAPGVGGGAGAGRGSATQNAMARELSSVPGQLCAC